jgi:hypothetical protein
MLSKKLVTLACAAGILACGACFLPPLPVHGPPPPPLRLDLQGIHRIRVEVTDASATHHLDAPQLASWIASQITAQARRAGVTGFAAGQTSDEDAVLTVSILSESANLQSSVSTSDGKQNREIEVSLAAALTRRDGQAVWRESDGSYRASRLLAQEPEADLWKEPVVQGWLIRGVGNRLVYRMLDAQ